MPRSRVWAPVEMKGDVALVKKIMKNIVAYFALYGQQVSGWNAII